MVPKDPVMLLSFINLKLRDFYPSLAALCDDLDIDRAEVDEKLAGIDSVSYTHLTLPTKRIL